MMFAWAFTIGIGIAMSVGSSAEVLVRPLTLLRLALPLVVPLRPLLRQFLSALSVFARPPDSGRAASLGGSSCSRGLSSCSCSTSPSRPRHRLALVLAHLPVPLLVRSRHAI